jgi:cellulose synthase/poly-beta-1,6-N-acetylglucosamine synthase-like glycosyltransferase
MILAEIVFWLAAFLIAYTYLLYPLLLFILYAAVQVRRDLASLRSGRDRPSGAAAELPSVALIVPAHNEETHLRRKLLNVAALDYPRDRLDVVFVSDGSTDGTNAILADAERGGARVILLEPRRGKFSALNAGVDQARGDILVFSDAATEFAPDALRNLVRHFADRTIGVVCGALRFRASAESAQTEGVYWTYECALRLMEAQLGATLTASGAIYAARRECYRPLTADDILDDFVIPMQARRLGYRVVFDRDAEALDYAGETVKDEFRRRVRLAVGSFRALADFLRVPMSGTTRLAFVSHKVLRWTLPFVMIALLAANACLLSRPVYRVTMAGQLLFYGWAALGFLSRGRGRALPGALLAYFLVAMNAAFLVGFFKFLTGRREVAWQRAG